MIETCVHLEKKQSLTFPDIAGAGSKHSRENKVEAQTAGNEVDIKIQRMLFSELFTVDARTYIVAKNRGNTTHEDPIQSER